jgi:hypothetical protein
LKNRQQKAAPHGSRNALVPNQMVVERTGAGVGFARRPL